MMVNEMCCTAHAEMPSPRAARTAGGVARTCIGGSDVGSVAHARDTTCLESKVCGTCGQTKPLTDFYLKDKATGRYASECKPCKVGRTASYRDSHPGYHAERSRVWRERYKDRNQAAYAADVAAKAERHARYEATAQQERERARQWRQDNPEAQRAQKHAARARALGVPGTFTADEWIALKATQEYRCLACNKREPDITLTIDHVIPMTKGGHNDIANIQGLCYGCNNTKRAKDTDYRKGDQ